MDIYDQLVDSTVKIICNNGESSGTGFFFRFNEVGTSFIPAIVTNKHVVENAYSIHLNFSLNDYFKDKIKKVKIEKLDISNIQKLIIYHEDKNIDLCIIPIGEIIPYLDSLTDDLQINYLGLNLIPPQEVLEDLRYVEDVMMVGYPSGISDEKNNFPIFRRGITATHPGVEFNGKPEFVVDMSIIPGSSGSPVFILNDNGYRDRNGNIAIGGTRFYLLGINKAVFTTNAEGIIIEEPYPTDFKVISRVGNNLGLIVMAKELYYFEREIKRRIESQIK
ncbi:serine protease [Macrococcoides goetzii]|nr:serine protease [Macrococcus goetzii]TDM50008.1 serine protease [Macrococcus goetzii]